MEASFHQPTSPAAADLEGTADMDGFSAADVPGASEVHPIWMLDLAFDIVAGLAFTSIGILLVRHLLAMGKRRVPPLATATAFILFVKGGGHFVHALLLAWPMPADGEVLRLARFQAGSGDIWLVDGIAAAAAVAYLVLRLRLGTRVAGASLYDDFVQRQHHAMNLHDHVVQHIVRARWSMDLDPAHSAAAIESASQAIKTILDELESKLEEPEVVAPG